MKIKVLEYRQYVDSREMTHTFVLLYNKDTGKSFYRYKWSKKNRMAMGVSMSRGDYGEKEYSSWAFNDFEDFIDTIKRDFDIQNVMVYNSNRFKKEEFLTQEDMTI